MSDSTHSKAPSENGDAHDLGIRSTYKDYFLQYASYVITDRAIPDQADGLKPVQRRILHSLWENDDGRYNKVANIVGHCMKYHPHGDASIYSAFVSLGQKGLLIDPQGNWGNPSTNDPAAAARYIEARLTPFAKEVVFAPHLTTYKISYDGRNREPITLPIRFPLLLATGTEGIAVGLTTRILPHNFIELLEAEKAFFRKESFQIYPDFPTGGMADVSGYRDGRTGGRVKVRARIEPGGGKSLVIREIPFGTTTESLIDSILRASSKGKIKVAHIEDNSAAQIEIVVTFQRGVDMDKAVDALYAFTDCETVLSSNGMVIREGRPQELSASEILIENARQTRSLLKQDLEIQQQRLEQRWHRKSLVQIFVENRIYLRIERCTSWESVLSQIETGLEPHKPKLRREVTQDDLVYLTEVRIRRISAWDSARAQEELASIDQELARVRRHLRHLTQYVIDYIDHLIETYGKGRERKTRITTFDSVKAVTVVERTRKLFIDRAGGFVGTDSRIGDEIGSCSNLDDILVILRDGGMVVTKVAAKKYVGEQIIHAQIFGPGDQERIFNLVYQDSASGKSFLKRFSVGGITRDKRYELGRGKKTSRILFLSRGRGCFAHVRLRKKPRISKLDLYLRFDEFLVKGRGAGGITLTRHKISSVKEISKRVYCDRLGIQPSQLLPSERGTSQRQAPTKPESTGQARLFAD
ncbi:MAG: DNA gyrase/topoisomerase IV subunit A [Acidobacteriota bacterium]